MSRSGWPAGYGRVILAETDSTNAEAIRRVPLLAGPEWILALRQSAARGRRGRPWAMPEGNFAGTLVMRPTEAPDLVALRSFVAALALHDAFVDATGRAAPFALKWPNDVLLNGGKVAGILLESAGTGRGVAHLVIGIGVNLAAAPAAGEVEPGALRPVSLLEETGAVVTPEEFLDLLASAYAAREAQFTTYGFGPIREAWLQRAARLGEQITARTSQTVQQGRFETVDAQGNLVLDTPDGRRAIPAAEIFF
ncbi:biotin--[acetyl-CoA-carboxylase] ligase [Acidimangrovimonas sediminis]|uniref:biotin--[acetyl-CoA-carboxylase] ligase n=1 Tax=Acidimangrovimonas sediminis TaxID=2056283 RepID=UPI001E443713|nr:biotin--[acetyl-CoA-carboxylase] ligase [Acidimangrovimonas sediminis]